jgi:hypothetical protein
MWGTSPPDDKRTGDLRNVIEAISIDDRGSDCLAAGKLAPGNLGLLQQNRHIASAPHDSRSAADVRRSLRSRPLDITLLACDSVHYRQAIIARPHEPLPSKALADLLALSAHELIGAPLERIVGSQRVGIYREALRRLRLLDCLEVGHDVVQVHGVVEPTKRHSVSLHLGLGIGDVLSQVGFVPGEIGTPHRVGVTKVLERCRFW